MSDAFKVFFAGIEEFARSMKEQTSLGLDRGVGQKELAERIETLIERVDRMVTILEEKLGTMVDIAPVKGKRMMDIKQRIVEEVEKHPEGIRPPQWPGPSRPRCRTSIRTSSRTSSRNCWSRMTAEPISRPARSGNGRRAKADPI